MTMPPSLPTPSGNPRSRDHIFISYSHADRALVERLANDLRDRGCTVWIDFEGIRGGDRWRQSIADGIHASNTVLVMLTPDAVQSEWVKMEVQTALDAGKHLIPLLMRALKTDADKAAYAALAPDFNEIQWREFTLGYDIGFRELLKELPKPAAGIPGHCQKIASRLLALPWGLDHYIQEDAKLLPVNASPYEDGIVRGERQNLLTRLRVGTRTLVLGEPGIGKTVTFERLSWELATADSLVVPILIKLLEYDGQPLIEWIRLKLIETGEITLPTQERTAEFLADMPFDAYILLDGLNEVRPAHRDAILGEITRLALAHPRHRIAVSSRVQDDGWRTLRQGSAFAETLLIQPITEEEARGYLCGHVGAGDGDALWSGLDQRMRELALTPLILWLIKEAYLEVNQMTKGGAVRIPDNRGALYKNFVHRMLRRDDDRGLGQKIPEEQRLAALERLALTLHRDQQLTIDRAAALNVLGGEAMLSALLVNGLLMGDRQIRFAPHQTMQEHFAARALEDGAMRKAAAKGITGWMRGLGVNRGELDYARDSWWWETFIQLAGLTENGNVLALALAEIDPWLAWWCFEEGGKFDKQVREKIANRSQALVYSQNAEDRRAAANALAKLNTPRVKDYLVKLSIDPDPIVSRVALSALLALGSDGERVFNSAFNTEIIRLQPTARNEIGRMLAEFGDVRPGVGVMADGLPAIDWVRIPDDGAWTYQNKRCHSLATFQISRYPITYAQFQSFVDVPDGFNQDEWWVDMPEQYQKQPMAHQYFKYANYPRENVSWYQAMAFCRWLSAKFGFVVTLPTEQQWEKAARGTDGRVYPYGNEFDAAKGNTSKTGIGQTIAVGMFPDGASPYGVLDMSGNVWEWCLNKYKYPVQTVVDASEDTRCLRGGTWNSAEDVARTANRDWNYPSNMNWGDGFRIVLVAPL